MIVERSSNCGRHPSAWRMSLVSSATARGQRDHVKSVAALSRLRSNSRGCTPSAFCAITGARPKVSDEFTMPLCRGHRREVDHCGDEAAWWNQAGIDRLRFSGAWLTADFQNIKRAARHVVIEYADHQPAGTPSQGVEVGSVPF